MGNTLLRAQYSTYFAKAVPLQASAALTPVHAQKTDCRAQAACIEDSPQRSDTPGAPLGVSLAAWSSRGNATLRHMAINVIIMDRAVTTDTELADKPGSPAAIGKAQRGFQVSMLMSGIRCAIAYVILPFFTPLLGIAPGIGPGLGIVIGSIAIAANLFSMRRFWVLRHPWRKPITALHIGVIGFLLVLIAMDLAQLLNQF